ncbi:molybdopterin oxidoreductase [Archangium sp. Cb G35]|nr:molybdopterin oxidoreductase [Archangium sp. Cb G35]
MSVTITEEPGATVVRNVCPHNCPDTCSILTTVKAGRAVEVRGNPDHPTTRGFLCAKVSRYLERTYHAGRVLHPMRRVGAKGEGRFEPISWKEALDEIARRFKGIIAEWGAQAILPYSFSGTLGLLHNSSMDRRFFHKLGASLLDRTICGSAGVAGMAYSMGSSMGMDTESFEGARTILLWGTNTLTSNPHLWPFVTAARKRGARVIAIDPRKTRTAEQCDEHIALLPGTDAALALGMMHVIFRDGLGDEDYMDRYCVGRNELAARAAEYPPERVAAICGIPAASVEALAVEYATSKPAAIRLNFGMQRHTGGGMAARAISCLPAVTGAWRSASGGLQLWTFETFPVNHAALQRFELIPPGTRTLNMVELGRILTEVSDPPVKALFVYNSNPASVAPDLERVKAGLRREDLFTVVHDQFHTDTANFADLLLPATTQLEHVDMHIGYGHLYVMWNAAAIAPLGEAIPNTELFRRLAAHMGFNEPCFQDSDESMARQALQSEHPWLAGITFERVQAEGSVRLNVPTPFAPYAEGGFSTPSGKCELFSARMARDGHDPLPAWTPPRESSASSPELFARYPLTLISPPGHYFLNSTFSNVLTRFEKGPHLEIHPTDAAARSIINGQRVRIRNDRGAFLADAVVTERARPGVVVAPSLWSSSLTPDGRNVNHTTSQSVTDMGGGATFYDNLVEVEGVS